MSELKTLRLIVLVVCGAADNHWPSVWWFIFRTYGLCPCLNWIALIVYIVMCACFILVRCIILEFIIPSYYYLVYSLTFSCSLNSYLVFWKAWCLFIFQILSNHIFRLPNACRPRIITICVLLFSLLSLFLAHLIVI